MYVPACCWISWECWGQKCCLTWFFCVSCSFQPFCLGQHCVNDVAGEGQLVSSKAKGLCSVPWEQRECIHGMPWECHCHCHCPRRVVAVRGGSPLPEHGSITAMFKSARRRTWWTTSWWVPGKITEQNLIEVISSRQKVTGNSLWRFAKNKFFLLNLVAVYEELTVSVDEGKQWACFHFDTASGMVYYGAFIVRLENRDLNGWTTSWVSNLLDFWPRKVFVNSKNPADVCLLAILFRL